LFAVASAIVTETGGVLSHAAVVAREYRLPAVLGVTDATRLIRDGDMLEVNGSEGTVRLLR
jgi:pyruvate,water dikinase